MTDHFKSSGVFWDDEGKPRQFRSTGFLVVLSIIALVVAINFFVKQRSVKRRSAPTVNVHYNGYSVSNYVGVQGSHDGVQNGFKQANGVFGKSTNTSLRDLTDGTASTIMVGERDLSENHAGIWMRSINQNGTKEDARAVVGVCHDKHPMNAKHDPHAFSSMHVGGAHFLLCDGSARFVSETLDPKIYNLSAQKSSGQPIPDF